MCGIIGISGVHPVAHDLYNALISLQHRGQDSAGIVTYDRFHRQKKGQGLVRDIYQANDLKLLSGCQGIAHVRYPTAGGYSVQEVQPFSMTRGELDLSLAHNGNVINEHEIRVKLLQKGHMLQSESDSELLLWVLAEALESVDFSLASELLFEQLCQAINSVYHQVKGAYSVVVSLGQNGLLAFRDVHGIRPLVLGRKQGAGDDQTIICSESAPFFGLGVELVDSIKAGEVVWINAQGKLHRQQLQHLPPRPCMFEYVYFARPDSILDDVSVYRARLRLGQNLAKRWLKAYPDDIPDVVIPVPFSSNTAALSCARVLGVRYTEGLYKNPFIGRTFIMPSGQQRKRSVAQKLSPQVTEINNKSVLLIDDSIVRGTTCQQIIRMVRQCGAKKVYFASTCPPIRHPCYYGIDIPSVSELIATDRSIEQIRQKLNVDRLMFQNIEDIEEALTRKGRHEFESPCVGCLNGDYVCGINQSAKERSRIT